MRMTTLMKELERREKMLAKACENPLFVEDDEAFNYFDAKHCEILRVIGFIKGNKAI